MKMIVLAAGRGTRLRPITENTPKCMVNLAEKPIIEWQIENALSKRLKKILIIGGFQSEKISTLGQELLINERFAETNMVYTLSCAGDELKDEVVVSYGDIYYESSVLEKVMDSDYDISIVVDLDWLDYWKTRFEDPLLDAETLKLGENSEILEIGQQITDLSDVDAQYIGLMKFSKKGSKILSQILNNIKNQNIFINGRNFESMYLTDILNYMIQGGITVNAIKIRRSWLEIDDLNDLEIAEQAVERVNGSLKVIA